MSLSKPRLLFAVEEDDGVWSFLSLPQLQNYEKSSSTLVAAEFHVTLFPGDLRIYPHYDIRHFSCAYASGLIYLYGCRYEGKPLICNPDTGRYATLPYVQSYRKSYSFFGFEPIDKQYKVLFMAYPSGPGHHKVLTLETGKMRWRKIKCSVLHDIESEGVCINGILYYLGLTADYENDAQVVIVCFDLMSEMFTFIDVEEFCSLLNYNGKLAMITWVDDVNANELHVWVQEDFEKQEWLKYTYTSDDKIFSRRDFFVAGVTAWGEIVFTMRKCVPEQPFDVFYFHPKRNTLRRVEIQRLGETSKKYRNVRTFVNHVEDLNVNDLKLVSSVYAPYKGWREDSESDSEGDKEKKIE